ncbi:MAG: putative sulfate exporter family transporter, partial [Leuconostoc falkenbergense]
MKIKANMVSGIIITLLLSFVAKILANWLPFLGA